MKFADNFPNAYIPPKRLEIGSCVFENVKAVLQVNDAFPILIGSGNSPRIWLNIPADELGRKWYPLVKDNFPTSPDVSVVVQGSVVAVSVSVSGIVLSCAITEKGIIRVTHLDLRPFGIDFFMEGEALRVFGGCFTRVNMKNSGVAFASGSSREADSLTEEVAG